MDIEYSHQEGPAHQGQFSGGYQQAPQQPQPQFGALFQNQTRTFPQNGSGQQMTGFFGMQPQPSSHFASGQQSGFFGNQAPMNYQGTGLFANPPQMQEEDSEGKLQAKDFLSDDEDVYNSAEDHGEEESGDEEDMAELVDEEGEMPVEFDMNHYLQVRHQLK